MSGRDEAAEFDARRLAPRAAAAEPVDEGPDVLHYIGVAWSRRWAILACVVAAFVIGAFDIRTTKPEYSASATLQMEPEPAEVFEFSAPRRTDHTEEMLRTQVKLIASPQVAQRVIDSLQLGRGNAAADPGATQSGALLERLSEYWNSSRTYFREALLDKKAATMDPEVLEAQQRVQSLLRGLEVRLLPKTFLVEITYTSSDNQRAKLLADEFARQFILYYEELGFAASETARVTAMKNVEDVRQQLEDIERQLLDYEIADVRLLEMRKMLSEGRVQELNSQVNQLMSSLIEQESRALGMDLATEQGLVLQENEYLSEIRKRLNLLRINRATLVAEARGSHPELVRVEREIAVLEEELGKAVEALRGELDLGMEVTRKTLEIHTERLREAEEDLDYLSRNLVEYNGLARDAETFRAVYRDMLQRSKELSITASTQRAAISIVEEASVPQIPSSPRIVRTLLVYAIAGLGIGLLGVVVGERVDRTVKSQEQVERALGLPTLGVLPFLGLKPLLGRGRGRVRLVTSMDANAPEAESFRLLRAALQYSAAGGRPKVVLFTSCTPGEGKSTAAANLALTIAGRGERVLLVDADLKKPVLHQAFEVPRGPGLSDLLTGNATESQCLRPSAAEPNLVLLSAGAPAPSPSDLLDSPAMRAFIARAREEHDQVIIDSPPLHGMADAHVLARAVDGVCIVVRRNVTPRDLLARVVASLDQIDARVLGVVYNVRRRDRREAGYYGYGYKGYFKPAPKPAKAPSATAAAPATKEGEAAAS